MPTKWRSRESALLAWKTRRARYHYMTDEEMRLRRNKLARYRYKTNPTVKQKHDARAKATNERVRECARIRYWKNPEKARRKARDNYDRAMCDPKRKANIYKHNRESTKRHREKRTAYSTQYNYFRRNGITNPTPEEKEVYQWLRNIRRQKPKGRSREMEITNLKDAETLRARLHQLYLQLELKPQWKSSTKMRQQ